MHEDREVNKRNRTFDYENYLCAMFVSNEHQRNAVFAIRALSIVFNIKKEISGLHESIRDFSMGKIKYDWWRNAIDATFKGQSVDHPILIAIKEALEYSSISNLWINRIIDARENLRYRNSVFSTMDELETYAENSSSAILYLQLQALGIQNLHADHCASHIGKAIGISAILRGIPFGIFYREIGIPSEVLAKHSISAERIIRYGPSRDLESAIFDTATRANDHLISARAHGASVSPDAFKVMLHAAPCDLYLKRLQKTNFNVFDSSLMRRSLLAPLHIWFMAKTRKF